jgi:hypothetical protein
MVIMFSSRVETKFPSAPYMCVPQAKLGTTGCFG